MSISGERLVVGGLAVFTALMLTRCGHEEVPTQSLPHTIDNSLEALQELVADGEPENLAKVLVDLNATYGGQVPQIIQACSIDIKSSIAIGSRISCSFFKIANDGPAAKIETLNSCLSNSRITGYKARPLPGSLQATKTSVIC